MKKTGIRFRVMIVMLLFATLPVVASTIVSSTIIKNSSEKEIIESNIARTEWAADYLEELIVQLDRMFYSLQINDDLMESITLLDNDNVSVQYESQNYMKDTLTTAFYANSRKIDELELYMDSYNKIFMVGYNSSGNVSEMNALESQWIRLDTANTNIYFEQVNDEIYAVHSVNTFMNQIMFAGLSVKINDNVWQELSDILTSETDGEIYMFNDEMKLMKGSSRLSTNLVMDAIVEHSDSNFKEGVIIETEDHYYFIHEVDETKLLIVKAVPRAVIKYGVVNAIKAGAFIVIVFVIISIVASVYVSLKISKPIISLADKMKNFEMDDLTVTNEENLDEIIVLENGYNKMITRLKELIEIEYQHEIELKNAQLLALQAQINPHFINNTMNLIGGMALEKNAPDIYDVSRRISDLLRYTIKTSNEMVTLKEELAHVKNYLVIQEKRFEDRCQINWIVEEGIDNQLIPKFILQPIVENAFEYGLQPKRGQWYFEINVFQKGNRIGIVIRDNGVGMTKERLAEIRTRLSSGKVDPNIKGGIGLLNVSKRLKLRFGSKGGIKIFSQTDKGTLMLLTICHEKRENINA